MSRYRAALFHNLPPGGARRAMVELVRATRAHVAWDVYDLAINPRIPDVYNYRFRRIPEELALSAWVEDAYSYPDPRVAWRDDALLGRAFRTRFTQYVRGVITHLDRLRYRRMAQHIAARIDAMQYDFVNVRNCGFTRIPPVAEYLRTPVVLTCEEPVRPAFERDNAPPRGLRAYMRILVADHIRAAHRAAVVLGNSRYSCDYIERAYGVQAALLYYGVDTQVFTPGDASRDDYVMSVGALQGGKGFDFLINSLATIPAPRRPPLVIASYRGSAAMEEKLTRLASEKSVALTFHHGCSDGELADLYRRAQATVFAPVGEPFGFVPLESMACGTPVIAVGEAGVLETVQDGDTGVLTARDEHAFGRAVADLLDHPGRRDSMGTRGRAVVEAGWTWDRTARNFVRQVHEILGARL